MRQKVFTLTQHIDALFVCLHVQKCESISAILIKERWKRIDMMHIYFFVFSLLFFIVSYRLKKIPNTLTQSTKRKGLGRMETSGGRAFLELSR